MRAQGECANPGAAAGQDRGPLSLRQPQDVRLSEIAPEAEIVKLFQKIRED